MKEYIKILINNFKYIGLYLGMVILAIIPFALLYLAWYYFELGSWVAILNIPIGVIEALLLISLMEYEKI